MKAIRLGFIIVKTQVKDRLFYPSRLIVDTIRVIARCGILLVLYWYVFRLNDGSIRGVTYDLVAWSMFFYFAFSVLVLRHIAQNFMEDIRTGTVEVLFSKPISYLAYRMWFQLGKGLYSFLVITPLGILAMILTIGIPETMTVPIFLPSIFLVVILGIVLSLFLYSIVGLFAFWIEDINPLFWTIDKAVMILGGSYLPIALFPPFLYKLAVISPFGASQFISHSVYASWQTEWLMKLMIQSFWIVVLGIIMYFMFKKAREKVSVNGG
jgi:ABC-2 type transport system permease protein